MRHVTHWVIMGVTVGLLMTVSPRRAEAQLPVIDVANLFQNTITALQTIAIVANQVLELTALGETIDVAEDLAMLQEIAAEAQGLGADMGLLMEAFQPGTELFGSQTYRETHIHLNEQIWRARSFALRAQLLITTAIRAIERIRTIASHVAEAIGNLTVSQSLGEAQGKLQQALVEANVTRTAFERAQSLQEAAPAKLLGIIDNTNRDVMSDHPR
jgi:conjugal transfer/entry exclusion protein